VENASDLYLQALAGNAIVKVNFTNDRHNVPFNDDELQFLHDEGKWSPILRLIKGKLKLYGVVAPSGRGGSPFVKLYKPAK
jgi:hypothetical protein